MISRASVCQAAIFGLSFLVPAQKPATGAKVDAAATRKKPESLYDAKGHVLGAPREGFAMGGKYGMRQVGRKGLARAVPEVAASIAAGLRWLAAHQDADGGFDPARFMRHDTKGKPCDGPGNGLGRVGLTGLCLLPFLGDGATLGRGANKLLVRRAVAFLRRQQRPTGAYSDNVLEHALATYAISEAAGLSASARLGMEASEAVAGLRKQQRPHGGFRFAGAGKAADAFTTFHAVLAEVAVRDFRLSGESRVFERLEGWLAPFEPGRVADAVAPVASGVLRPHGDAAARLFLQVFAGQRPDSPRAVQGLLGQLPSAEAKRTDPVFYYLASHALYQIGGKSWRRWSKPLLAAALQLQRKDGNFAGSFDPRGQGALLGGRVYSTALWVLTLECYYRYARLLR